MPSTSHDILGLGNAIVDVIARADDDMLVAEGLAKGSMTLVDDQQAERLYAKLGQTVLVSGGSAANTCAGVASLGARAAFIGKVSDDQLGASFRHDLNAAGVRFATPPASGGPGTGRCMILVTPDGERTMSTYLGASSGLGPDDVDPELVAASGTVFLEGYLWDPPAAKAAFRRAAEIAHGAGRKVALTLSDTFCVDRHRAEFLELMRSGAVDILLANEHEAKALYETGDTATAMAALAADAPLAVVTMSEKGAVVLSGLDRMAVPAHPVDRVVDATGAGDLFAAGFLVGLARGMSYGDAARLGAMAAAEVISHMGARPERRLDALAAEVGLAVPA